MSEANYRPSGDMQGDSKAMPDRGTGTGVEDSYGASLDGSAINSKGSITGSTKSDGMQEGGLSKNKR